MDTSCIISTFRIWRWVQQGDLHGRQGSPLGPRPPQGWGPPGLPCHQHARQSRCSDSCLPQNHPPAHPPYPARKKDTGLIPTSNSWSKPGMSLSRWPLACMSSMSQPRASRQGTSRRRGRSMVTGPDEGILYIEQMSQLSSKLQTIWKTLAGLTLAKSAVVSGKIGGQL